MNAIDAVAMQAAGSIESITKSAAPVEADLARFVTYLQETNAALNTSNDMMQKSALGESIAPHELMLSLESAKLQLQMLIEVRNRCVEAYQEVMRMQV